MVFIFFKKCEKSLEICEIIINFVGINKQKQKHDYDYD